jgi:hypothetical protein
MYDPVKDGVAKTVESVIYTEARPPATLGELVHCYWELRTVTELAEDFTLRRGDPDASVDHYVGEPYEGDLALVQVSEAAAKVDFDAKATVFSEFVATLLDTGLVAPNPVTAAILTNLDEILSVSDGP